MLWRGGLRMVQRKAFSKGEGDGDEEADGLAAWRAPPEALTRVVTADPLPLAKRGARALCGNGPRRCRFDRGDCGFPRAAARRRAVAWDRRTGDRRVAAEACAGDRVGRSLSDD
jgi:hypothetical protein